MTVESVPLVGRDQELTMLAEFLAGDEEALLLTGGPGIGKTALWKAGIALAEERGLHILSARPSGAEAELSLTALSDLLEEVSPETFARLPAPQCHALQVALLRADPSGGTPEARTVAVAFLNVLRELATQRPVLVAVDDVQWLDASSVDALTFAARRLEGHRIRMLLTKRSEASSILDSAHELRRLEVGPLSFGAIRRLLSERLALTLPRRVLRRLFETADGNPLFALELARSLVGRQLPRIGEEFALPTALEDLFGDRVERLAKPLRRLLLATSLSAEPRFSELEQFAARATIEEAIEAEVLALDGARIRAWHPLLAAAARRKSSASERRELHADLAGVVADRTLSAYHLALASEGPDIELAGVLTAAARSAASRGVAETAVALAEHALRLTPPDSLDRADRLIALAEYLMVAGEPQRATDLLLPEVERLPAGAARARAHLVLAESRWTESSHVDEMAEHFDRALAESEADPALRAVVLARKSRYVVAGRVERIAEGEAWALEALELGQQTGRPEVEREALHALGLARSLRGGDIDDLRERFHAVSGDAFNIVRSLDRLNAARIASRGDVEEGRAILRGLLALADERGATWAFVVLRQQLCEVELWGGCWDSAERLLDEWSQTSEGGLLGEQVYERCQAFLALGRGDADEAERWNEQAIARCEAHGLKWDLLLGLWQRGMIALLAHDAERAVESFRPVWEHTRREGVEAAGAFPVAAGLVEALVELGEHEEARAVAGRFRALAEQQEHPWGLATAKRCDGLLLLAEDQDRATGLLAEAAADYDALAFRFASAQALLALGRAQRRNRRWAAARAALEQASTVFEEIGSPGWAEEARGELERISARKPRPSGELTPSEHRIVELAAKGLSNKEIAQELVVTVNTVERHLSHAYAKLGVRSRTQLAARLR